MIDDQLITKLNAITKQYYGNKKEFEKQLILIWEEVMQQKYNPLNLQTYNQHLLHTYLTANQQALLAYVDKVSFKEQLKKWKLEQYMVPTYAVINDQKQLNINFLLTIPKPCILKLSNGTENEDILILETNNKEQLQAAVDHFLALLKPTINKTPANFYETWCYMHLKPQLIIEPKLGNNNLLLDDYKFFVFNNKIFCMHMDKTKITNTHLNSAQWNWDLLNTNIYDTDTNISIFNHDQLLLDLSVPLAICKQIKKHFSSFNQLRVDCYFTNNQWYVGEITFNTANAFFTFWDHKNWQEFDKQWGWFCNQATKRS